jgi:hypothetical protein
MSASSQVAPERVPKAPEGPTYKYEAYVGWGYTSLNQVNQSRSGLQGVTGEFTRGFGDHFGVTLDGAHYAWPVTSANIGNPTVDLFLAGPEVRGDLYEKFSGFAHGLIGVAHTGGVTIQPNISFAGGAGVGVDYNKTARFSIRAFGDAIESSFTVVPYEPGDSPHKRWNARGGVGVVYHF